LKDLGPSLEKQLGHTSDSGRKDSQPGGEASVKSIAIPQDRILLPPPPPPTQLLIFSHSLPLPSSLKPKKKAEFLQCPWGVPYGVNGEQFPCSLTSNIVKHGKVLQHWAWQHVANEASAIRRGIISLDQAQIVNTREKLETAIFHLGLCPNLQCCSKSPMRLWWNKPSVIAKHLTTHAGCRIFFPRAALNKTEDIDELEEEGIEGVKDPMFERVGYKEMGKLLGFVSPVRPKPPDVLPVGGQLFDGRLH
jgi:hypothetical protein